MPLDCHAKRPLGMISAGRGEMAARPTAESLRRSEAGGNGQHRLAHHQAADVRSGAERHANSDLPGAARHRIAHDAEEAHGREDAREHGEGSRDFRGEALPLNWLIMRSRHANSRADRQESMLGRSSRNRTRSLPSDTIWGVPPQYWPSSPGSQASRRRWTSPGSRSQCRDDMRQIESGVRRQRSLPGATISNTS